MNKTITEQRVDYCEPGLIKATLLKNLQGPGPHLLLDSQAELIIFEGQYLLHWLDDRKEDQYKFLSQEQIREAFTDLQIASGWLPPGVQQWGKNGKGTWMVLCIPAGRHTITLTGPAMPQEPVSIPFPSLVFAGISTDYYVWAAKDEIFSPTLPLYHAPLPNVHTNGSICFGQNQPPPCSNETILQAWDLFIRSPFNGDLADNKSGEQRKDVRHQLCAVQKEPQYPLSDLLPVKEVLDPGHTTITMMVEKHFVKAVW